jgi:hypothetical protein
MTDDARYEDAAERALCLVAEDAEGLQVISALVQDAVFPITEMKWEPRARRLSFLINRFRWEDRAAAEARGRPYERVQSVLAVGDVAKVSSQGIDRGDADTILSVLAITWEPGKDGAGRIMLALSGDGAIAADVECVNLTLKDVTRPYLAPSRHMPKHPE